MFVVVKRMRVELRSDIDIVAARRGATDWARELGFSTLERTKVVTAVSELARNTVLHGLGGAMSMEQVHDGFRAGLRMTFEDTGPGIADIDRALQDGYSTGSGMGLGLPGARRLVNDFALTSTAGVGTNVTILKWKS